MDIIMPIIMITKLTSSCQRTHRSRLQKGEYCCI